MNNMFADDAELCAADLRCFLMRVIVTPIILPMILKNLLSVLNPDNKNT